MKRKNNFGAGARISTEAENAKSVDEIPDSQFKIKNSKLKISVTNGWLVCDGKLLIGGTTADQLVERQHASE